MLKAEKTNALEKGEIQNNITDAKEMELWAS